MRGMRVVAVVIAMGVFGASCGGEEPTKCNKENAAILKATNLDDGSGVSLKVFVDGVYKETLAPGETYKEFVDKGQSYFIEMTLINDSVVCSTSTPTLGECIEYSVEC